MTPGLHHHKKMIRADAKGRRSVLSSDMQEKGSALITESLLTLVDEYPTVMVYASKPPEVATHYFICSLLGRGQKVVVPIIETETRTLRLSYLGDPSTLVRSTYNVPEPIGNEKPARPEDVKVAIIPLIAFDTKGNRIGYGAGYYDRFLKKYPHILKIGIAYAIQKESSLPCDADDVRMDWIVTEEGIFRCNQL